MIPWNIRGCEQKAGPERDRKQEDVWKESVEAYIKNGYNAAATVRELGYPSHTAVVLWYQELREKGCLKESYQRERQYSEAERRRAVEYYFTHGKSMSRTIQALELPIKRDALRNWIREFAPGQELNCKRAPPLVEYSQAQKEAALAQFCSSDKTAEQVAQEHGVSRAALYSWRRKLMAREVDISMPERKGKPQTLEEKNAQLLQELQRVRRELEETENRLHRAQLECDVLEKVAEVLKKEKGADPRKLSNREKARVIGACK